MSEGRFEVEHVRKIRERELAREEERARSERLLIDKQNRRDERQVAEEQRRAQDRNIGWVIAGWVLAGVTAFGLLAIWSPSLGEASSGEARTGSASSYQASTTGIGDCQSAIRTYESAYDEFADAYGALEAAGGLSGTLEETTAMPEWDLYTTADDRASYLQDQMYKRCDDPEDQAAAESADDAKRDAFYKRFG